MSLSKAYWVEQLGEGWTMQLKDILRDPYMEKLNNFLNMEYITKKVHPPREDVFNAFRLCPWENVKVVILGVDPNLNIGANGLCYASRFITRYYDEALCQIRARVERDFYNDLHLEFDYSMENWAKQGILMLNIANTAVHNEKHSHLKPWNKFTISVIQALNNYKPGTIFMLWGDECQKMAQHINPQFHDILLAKHPGENPSLLHDWETDNFIKADKLLIDKYGKSIKW